MLYHAAKERMRITIDLPAFTSLEDQLDHRWSKSSGSLENFRVIAALYSCLKVRDPLTAMHSLHMAKFSYSLALRFDRENAPLYYAGSLTHDIGKIGMTDKVLKGNDILSPEERHYLRIHVNDGYRILSELGMPSIMLQIVQYHHERYDGSGYLEGLKGDNIPLPGRITAISDTYSALTSERPYSKALDHNRAIEIMKNDAGQFDPSLLEYFIHSVKLSTLA